MNVHLNRAHLVATLLENKFKLFGFRFGLSAIIDLIPGLGDIVDLLLSLYIVWLATQLHLPLFRIIQMLWNVLLSFLVGLLPIIGDAGYIFYKPNLRNLRILEQYSSAKLTYNDPKMK